MSKAYVFFSLGTSGGTATLSIRIAEWLLSKKNNVLYICPQYTDLNNVKSMKEIGIKIHKWETKEIAKKIKMEYDFEKYIFITYTLDDFFYVETLKKELNICENILYVVSYSGLIIGKNSSLIIKYIIKKFYGKIINRLINYGSIIYMDYTQFENDLKYYCFDLDNHKEKVYFLPMLVKSYNEYYVCKKLELDSFNILTIARADFPFKGYIVGLIDDYVLLNKNYKQITLTIITFGKNELDIMDKVNLLSKSIQDKIRIVGQTRYKDLPKFFSSTHLFIGMGTTLLDAVNEGTPSIVVQANTYENKSSGFFHMQPERLAAYEDKSVPAIEYIKNVIEMDKSEYINLCRLEHETLTNYYNIEKLCEFLLVEKQYDKSISLFNYEILIHKVLKKMNMKFKKMVFKK